MKIPVAMTIAGCDSGGGAGIVADIKTFSSLGVYGTVVITSVTAQNTREVRGVFDIPGSFVYEQIATVVEDIGVDAAKTGMLSNPEIVESVSEAVDDYKIRLVVDPVIFAKSGARLLSDDALDVLKKKLLPKALVITPNAHEASVLSGYRVNSIEEAVLAARKISEIYGVKTVVVKGGHLPGERVVDVVYHEGEYRFIESERYPGKCFHGAGCSFSAAITAYLAMGQDVLQAIMNAKKFIDTAIYYGLRVGSGFCPVNPMAYLEIPALRYWAIENVRRAVELILDNQSVLLPYVPEVGMNVVEAISPIYAESLTDIVGVEGRIVKAGRRLVKVGEVKPGGSSHLGRLILGLLRNGVEVRGGVNIRYTQELVKKAEAKGYIVIFIDRAKEPAHLKSIEGRSMEWMSNQVASLGIKPDIIYDTGDFGKEAMIRVLGRSSIEAVEKLLSLL